MPLIEFSDKELYCPAGGFYIDPRKPDEITTLEDLKKMLEQYGK